MIDCCRDRWRRQSQPCVPVRIPKCLTFRRWEGQHCMFITSALCNCCATVLLPQLHGPASQPSDLLCRVGAIAMVRLVKVAATQLAISRDPAANLVRSRWHGQRQVQQLLPLITQRFIYVLLQAKAEKIVRQAAAAGANIILLQVGTLCSPRCSCCHHGRPAWVPAHWPPQYHTPCCCCCLCRNCLRMFTSVRSRSRCALCNGLEA